ncbi:hypothetical protein [Streptomyces sp. NPDC002490]|uniref:hypothetical protein n=1 Tax=Streptomyces sp. NPDC002490 TaxID=3154416 RepID=UPI003320F2C9
MSIGTAAACPAAQAGSEAVVALVRMPTAELRPTPPPTTRFRTRCTAPASITSPVPNVHPATGSTVRG